MATKKAVSFESQLRALYERAGVGRNTLEGTPMRALQLLRAIGTSLPIRAALYRRGYNERDHQEGWRRLHACSGFVMQEADSLIDGDVRDAIAELDAWDEPAFKILSATLKRRFPAQHAFLLEGLQPSTGAEALLGIRALLDRMDQMEKGPSRKATRKQDAEALALLAERGIDSEARNHLRALLAIAQRAEEPPPLSNEAKDAAQLAHVETLVSLREWFEEWSEIARACVSRRDYLIRMGLASRRSGSSTETQDTEPAEEPAAAE
ncbi:MAG: hypothetical protein KC766_12970 [Myxococcales bacterium]|nr:hypothetical protein [Myxococcales bacterium]